MKSRPFKILGPALAVGHRIGSCAQISVVPRCHRRGSLHPLNKICVSVRDAVRDFQGQSSINYSSPSSPPKPKESAWGWRSRAALSKLAAGRWPGKIVNTVVPFSPFLCQERQRRHCRQPE